MPAFSPRPPCVVTVRARAVVASRPRPSPIRGVLPSRAALVRAVCPLHTYKNPFPFPMGCPRAVPKLNLTSVSDPRGGRQLASSPSPSSSPYASGNKPFQNSRPAGAEKILPQPPSSFRPVSLISGLRVGRSVLLGNSKVAHRNEAFLQVIQKPLKLKMDIQ